MAALSLNVDPLDLHTSGRSKNLGISINASSDETTKHTNENHDHSPGFEFDLTYRNNALARALSRSNPSIKANNAAFDPRAYAMSTGTTIVGVCYKDGLVLGADTRATAGVVADKNCEKIHYIAPNIYCCGAGTAADTEMTTALIAAKLELMRRNTGSPSRVVTALTQLKRYLFNYQGHVSAALVLGGVDVTGPHLYTVYPHGSTDKLPFVTMGSGSLAAMAVFEKNYKDDMTEEEAVEMVRGAIESGIFNDLGSGSNVDVCIIRKEAANCPEGDGSAGWVGKSGQAIGTLGIDYRRNAFTPNEQSELRKLVKRDKGFDLPRGCTKVRNELVVDTATKNDIKGLEFLSAATSSTSMETEGVQESKS
eukprot:g3336.t1